MRAQNVGIHAMEMYFPKTYISQEELEEYNKVGKGKYTLGLLQKEMAFCQAFEDINSISLTVVKNLLEKYNIDPRSIGRLEIGTETLLDKAKSTKTVLMQLFKECGNHDIEGITTINACYGGTAALFNTLAWTESSAWDSRYGIVVVADIAVYKKGPARPTGGAGSIAMLVGPNAPMVIEPLRATFIDHTYDFYKPDPRSEFPIVDGHISIHTYVNAIDQCYSLLQKKQVQANQEPINLQKFDYGCFHAPFGKMVQKAYTKLVHKDVLNGDQKVDPAVYAEIQSGKYDSKPVQQSLGKIGAQFWNQKVKPSLEIGSKIGNIYTGSLYAGLCSIISDPKIDLTNKRIMMFSYGSGCASSMFLIRVNRNIKYIADVLDSHRRLDQRVKFNVSDFEDYMVVREQAYGGKDSKPQVNLDHLEDGAFYLTEIDNMWRRTYARKPVSGRKSVDLKNLPNQQVQQQQVQKPQIKAVSASDIQVDESRLEQINRQVQQAYAPNKLWNGFYKKTIQERLDQLEKVDPQFDKQNYLNGGLEIQKANLMVENCVGKISIPMGLGLNFRINNKSLQIPMAIEEPSVVAAASSAGKFISEQGSGFQTYSSTPVMIGQIQLLDVDSQLQVYKIQNNKETIIEKANQFCQSMVKRGGGVKDLRVRTLDAKNKRIKSTGLYEVNQMVVVDLYIDVCDSMGANITNTICESVAPYIQEITGARIGIKILSNLCVERRAGAIFKVPVKDMAWKSAKGEEVAKRIIETYRFAQLDPFRAATHNKGIMNGIDAVAIALGQDWRSIESSCHAFASYQQEQYQPLSHFEIVEESGEIYFQGSMEVPISVGTKGGVVDNNKLYDGNLRLLGYPSAQEMSEIMVVVGLAQNFAALRALAVEGIQKGHMSLHAKNIAISAGVPAHLAEDAARFMKKRNRVSGEIAKEYLKAYNMYGNIRQQQKTEKKLNVLSSFYVELNVPNFEETLSLHIALDCGSVPIHVSMEKSVNEIENKDIHNQLFGEKGYFWLQKVFSNLESARLDIASSDFIPLNKNVVPKLKLVTILIDLLLSKLLVLAPEVTTDIINKLQNLQPHLAQQIIENSQSMTIRYGLSLLSELTRIFYYNIDQSTNHSILKTEIVSELNNVLNSQIASTQLWGSQKQDFYQFYMLRRKRLSCTMMLLCDCLNMKHDEINPEFLAVLKDLGGIYELESTCVHDLQRWNPHNKNDINIYTFWLKSMGLQEATSKEVLSKFIEQCKDIINGKEIMVHPKLNEKLQSFFKKATAVIKERYDFDKCSFKQFEKTEIKPRL